MPLILLSIKRPTAVVSVVLMIVLGGIVALLNIPIQLTPDTRKPVLTIFTTWPGASTLEVEREVTNRQEDALRGIDGLEKVESTSRDSGSRIVLEFNMNTNMDRALMLVSNRLSNVNGIPSDVQEPRIRTRDAEDNPIAWFTVSVAPGNKNKVYAYGRLLEDVVQDRLERIRGVGLVNVWGGRLNELRIIVDPQRMARFGLTVTEMASALRGANASISAGDVEEGKRRYVVRTDNELSNFDRINNLVIRSGVDAATGRISRVTVADVARVEYGLVETDTQIRANGKESVIINVIRDTGVNVIEVMKEVKAEAKLLSEGPLKNAGLIMTQVHDDTIYINSAIGLVQQNIIVGGLLAAMVLLIFLRSIRATLIIAMAIPISVIGSFVAMAALGRSINVISLAGIAFAVGMVVDAAIVVLENIYRHRQMGDPASVAAARGAGQVWGAIFVSAATTVMVFVPILIMKLEVGQLFRDIAVAISVSVLLSLIISITVIPALSNVFLKGDVKEGEEVFRIPLIDPLAHLFVRFVLGYTRQVVSSKSRSLLVVASICGIAAVSTWAFLPKLEYLPEGNRNLLIARILPPAGYNLGAIVQMAEKAESFILPLFKTESSAVSKPGDPPQVERFWFIIRRGFTLAAAAAVDPARLKDLIPIVQRAVFSEPGSRGFVSQTSLFGRGFGGGRNIELDISGPDLDDIVNVASKAMPIIMSNFPRSEGHQWRAIPGLQLLSPEIRIKPDPQRLADVGMSARELGDSIDAFNDGIKIAEVTIDGSLTDLMVRGPHKQIANTQGIYNIPVVTRSGHILPAGSLSKIEVTASPDQIRHLDRERSISISIGPSRDMPLEVAMDIVRNKIIKSLKEQGLPAGISIKMSGTADALTQTFDSMVINLIAALIIVYLVMAILFESFVYPSIIMFSVPLATAGGIGGLALLNAFSYQALDMLTLLGFVILIGIVVNNAILLVHQTLVHVREENMVPVDAILEATRNRLRPIFMSTLTSIFGMLPLVIFPGEGSELYRGLGSVVIGGLALSAVLTLLIIPPLLGLITAALGTKEAGATMQALESPAE
ncbi:MAG: efflux RND transporter permease subunit [Rhodospirillales bacterium]|nr:efflux RND transporter permease subunit [Rhodospirillales bacterium]